MLTGYFEKLFEDFRKKLKKWILFEPIFLKSPFSIFRKKKKSLSLKKSVYLMLKKIIGNGALFEI